MANVQYLNPPGTTPVQGLYSHAARVAAGELIFVAGQVSVGSDGKIVGVGDFAAQFRQVYENLRAVLAGVGTDFPDVVKFTTYLLDTEYLEPYMRLRAELLPKLFPARAYPPNTLIIVESLVREEFLLEIEAVVRARS